MKLNDTWFKVGDTWHKFGYLDCGPAHIYLMGECRKTNSELLREYRESRGEPPYGPFGADDGRCWAYDTDFRAFPPKREKICDDCANKGKR